MERLTKWNGSSNQHAYYPRSFEEPCDGGGCRIKDCPFETAVCERLAVFEDIAELCGGADRLRELAEADKDGRVVVLPCKVGERWVDEDGRAVRITAVIVSMEPFGENINIYFDYEDATPDDAGSDCVTNWDHFSRLFTCAETVLDNRKDADDD